MDTIEKLTLPFGCTRALPDGVRVAWGARMIAPDDLLHDRQGCAGGEEGGPERAKLLEWLSAGAGEKARAKARELRLGLGSDPYYGARAQGYVSLHCDGIGEIVASPQGSHGHVYVAAWLHEHAPLQPIEKLASYTGEGNPPVAQVFDPVNAWQVLAEPRAATLPYLRELAEQGAQSIAVQLRSQPMNDGGEYNVADFALAELLA